MKGIFIFSFKKYFSFYLVIFLLIFSELAFRIIAISPEAAFNWNKFSPSELYFSSIVRFTSDPVLFWKMQENYDGYYKGKSFKTNSMGFRSNEIDLTRSLDLEKDIALFGRSESMGTGVEMHESWPEIINSKGPFKISNFSMSGYSIYQVERLMEIILEKHPFKKVILPIFFAEWDALIPIRPPLAEKNWAERRINAEKIISPFYAYHYLKLLSQDFFESYLSYDWPRLIQNKPDLKNQVSLSIIMPRLLSQFQNSNRELIIVFLPRPTLLTNLAEYDRRQEVIRQLTKYKSAKIIDVESKMQVEYDRSKSIYLGDIHPNAEIHEQIAEIVQAGLLEHTIQ